MQNETLYRRFSKLVFNPKNEITNAVMGENTFAWALDPIGNRISATKNDEPENYSANSLNQYTQISDGVTNVPTYDLDGNMLTYNGWAFTWNGENRLIQASNSEHVISYAYDYQGRMFQKVVDGATNTFIWDGFNIVAEISPGQTNFNVWGLDLSGTLQGAGGIGGLLSVTMPSAPCPMHFPLSDANGNVTEYVDTNSTVVAHREYSAFGETLALTGSKKDDFTFWFSTKLYDPLTKISHYQRRDYWAELGRWLSRDSIEEQGGSHLYGFCGNDAVGAVDPLGLAAYELHHLIPEWLARYSSFGPRSAGLRVLLSHEYHMGAGTGLHQRGLEAIRRAYESGAINYYGAYNRVLLSNARNAAGIFRNARQAASQTGRNPIVWEGGGAAVVATLGYTSGTEALVAAGGVGLVAGGAVFAYWGVNEYLEQSQIAREGEYDIQNWNDWLKIGQRRGTRDAGLVVSELMPKLTCSEGEDAKKGIKECQEKFTNIIVARFGFFEAMYAQPDIDFPIAETRLGLLEVKFAELLKCLEDKACCRPKSGCPPSTR